ncbi:Tryptophanyl-tRNA synthetase [Clostridiaceae bacterium JG1575]|nr:Tryptophanyl-tRNA synthetase [Clostridiaceae bacterium JG1575]
MTDQPIKKSIVFSGIQPTGNLTLGNYLGAIKNWVQHQEAFENLFCVVDLHAITLRQNPAELRKRSLEVAAIYLASGINPKESAIFLQSHVPEHTQLSWILTCNSYMGELSRMTQYKTKSQNKEGEAIEAGLFTYPILMAADILLYQTEFVPVGQDQVQHVELTRDLALRFNNAYSPTFTIPKALLPKAGAKIMDLSDPMKKMSKSSDNPNSFIRIMDPPEDIKRKISRSVTDSLGVVAYSPEQPGIMNLLDIMAAISNRAPEELAKEYQHCGYKAFKEACAQTIIDELAPVQQRVNTLLTKERGELEEILAKGAQKAHFMAQKTLRKVYKKVGLIPPLG